MEPKVIGYFRSGLTALSSGSPAAGTRRIRKFLDFGFSEDRVKLLRLRGGTFPRIRVSREAELIASNDSNHRINSNSDKSFGIECTQADFNKNEK